MNKIKMKTDFSEILNKFPSVLSVYLFGSSVAGVQREGSDVDIAVTLDENLSTDAAMDLRFRLMDVFENHFNRRVDVVIFNSASLKLIHQVLTHGVLIYAKEPERAQAFALRKRKEYFDFKYYIDKDIKQMRAFFQC